METRKDNTITVSFGKLLTGLLQPSSTSSRPLTVSRSARPPAAASNFVQKLVTCWPRGVPAQAGGSGDLRTIMAAGAKKKVDCTACLDCVPYGPAIFIYVLPPGGLADALALSPSINWRFVEQENRSWTTPRLRNRIRTVDGTNG